MPDTLAQYSFLPWLRQGFATKLRDADTLGANVGESAERASFRANLVLRYQPKDDGAPQEQYVEKQIHLHGPGDIVGIDQRALIRTFPARHVPDFEPNLLPYIEFYEEDFPWRYTPAAPAGKKLRPWLVLVVLKDKRPDLGQETGEYELQTRPEGNTTVTILPSIDLLKIFPPDNEAWAWAHVQLNQTAEPTQVAEILRQNPDSGLSRLLSPRKLVKNTAYTAFLLPAFETGRRAGLGEDPAAAGGLQKSSWSGSSRTFPVYYQWSFKTGIDGDFESLVSVLKPVETKAEAGTLPMDVRTPGYGLDGAFGVRAHLGFEAALLPPTYNTATFPAQSEPERAVDTGFQEKLQRLLNTGAEDRENDPVIVPPIYGQWHALAQRIEASNPAWLHDLNLDPKRRAAAGLGTETVRKSQEDLMRRAWQQVDAINEANRKIREGQFAKMITDRLYIKHLSAVDDDKFLRLTASMQGLTKRTDALKTLRAEIGDSRVPWAAQTAGFRKITRPQGPVSKVWEQSRAPEGVLQASALQQLNAGGLDGTTGIATAYLKTAPASALSQTAAIQVIEQQFAVFDESHILVARTAISQILDGVDMSQGTAQVQAQMLQRLESMAATGRRSARDKGSAAPPPPGGLSGPALDIAQNFIQGLENITMEEGRPVLGFQKAPYEALFGSHSNNKYLGSGFLKRSDEELDKRKIAGIAKKEQISLYLEGLRELEGFVNQFQQPALKPALPASIATIRADLQKKLSPLVTVDRLVRHKIQIWDVGVGALRPLESLKPVMKYPEFPEPMYEQVKKLSQDFILPNVSQLPPDSMTIMVSNQPFIEAYMAGLNHEMARELLWREFPTDQKGSYFRQFWKTTDNILETDESKKLDIREMHGWRGALGQHAPNGGNNLVLVVRGRLFMKYPNTVLFAQKAAYPDYDPADPNKTKPRVLAAQTAENVRFPIFSAFLEPDIFLFGFPFDAVTARGERVRKGESTAGKNPGWFFVFKERPGQTKFGLDDFADPIGGSTWPDPAFAPADWTTLTWEHLVEKPEDMNNYLIQLGQKHIEVTTSNGFRWNDNAADMAAILLQNPVMYARHAEEMIG